MWQTLVGVFVGVSSLFSGLFATPNSQPAAAAAATPAPVVGTLPAGYAAPVAATTTPTAPTVIQNITQPVIQHTVERIVQAPAQEPITLPVLALLFNQLDNKLTGKIANITASNNAGLAPVWQAVAQSQRIDQLTNTNLQTPIIVNPAVNGGTLSGVTLSATSITTGTLTASGTASLATTTVSGDLTVTGSTSVAGSLTVNGTITGGSLAVSGLSSGGAVSAPYFTATSSTATSTFAGGITGPGDFVVQSNSGNVGIGTTSPWAQLSINPNGITGPAFAIGSSTATNFVVTNGGNVGVGTTSPSSLLHIFQGASGGTTASGSFTLESNSSAFMQFLAPSTGQIQLRFGDEASNGVGLLAYNHTDDSMRFFTAGTEKIRFTSAGNIGIGTTTPWGKLSVTGSGTGTGLAFAVANSSNAPKFVILDNGSVGIGTSSPTTRLNVVGSDYHPIHMQGPDTALAAMVYENTTANSNTQIWRLGVTGSAGYAGTAAGTFSIGDQNTNIRMAFTSSGNVGIGTTTPATKLQVGGTANRIIFLDDSAINGSNPYNFGIKMGASAFGTAGAWPTWGMVPSYSNADLNFVTEVVGDNRQFSSSPNVWMTINRSSGNVGIGTTSPGAKLHIAGAGSNNTDYIDGQATGDTLFLQGTSGNGAGQIAFQTTTGVVAGIKGLFRNSGPAGDLIFQTRTTSGNVLERMRILFSGNVGIGTTTPWGKLSVTGTGTGTSIAFAVADSGNSPKVVVQDNGNVGIGTTSPSKTLEVAGTAGITGGLTISGNSVASGGLRLTDEGSYKQIQSYESEPLYINPLGNNTIFNSGTGNVGIGTTSPALKLQVDGNVGPNTDNTYTDGTATYRWSAVYAANGTIQTSDARLKSNVTDLNYGLSDLLKLRPVSFTWTAAPQQGTKLGFIAQEVQGVMPEVVNTGDDANHTLGITYTEFIPTIVKAVQELNATLQGLAGTVAGFAERFATKELSFDRATGNTLCLNDSNGTPVCINGDDLQRFLNGQSSAQVAASATSNTSGQATSTTASITLNGANPAQWIMGTAWQDNLGALLTHNGTSETVYSTSTVNTAITGTTTIDYWAIWYPDPNATTSAEILHTTRDVVVIDSNIRQESTSTTGTSANDAFFAAPMGQ